ncbi:MAG: type B 50S ribosomal protein L31 [bacterium]
MKSDIHPDYDFVVFKDSSSDFAFLTRSTKKSKEKIKWQDGKEYPLILLEITSASHPFFTGKQQLIDSAGRVEKFMRKYGMAEKQSTKGKSKGTKEEKERKDEAAATS